MHQNEEYVRQALRYGAAAYLLKDAAPQELERAIQAVLQGETYLSPVLATRVTLAQAQSQNGEQAPTEQLTPRQVEVLRMVVQGHSSKEIARVLDVSVKTVDSHRTSLMKQLDIHEVTGLVRYAMRTGLISSGH
jgi:DNA-binding NarL/FixJ family response regulator